MDPHYTYLFILACSLAGPLLLSFDKKVAFYKKWKYVFPAMILPALIYIAWDMYFVREAVWGFNEYRIVNINLGNLPLEETLFFFIVPYCCVFIYQCIRSYFPKLEHRRWADIFLQVLSFILLVVGIIFYKKAYTCWTFVALAFFISLVYYLKDYFRSFNAAAFLISYAIMLIPFLVVNGFLTKIPVVLYNNTENLGIKIYSIPGEDIFYGMLLVMMNVVIYEKLKLRGAKRKRG